MADTSQQAIAATRAKQQRQAASRGRLRSEWWMSCGACGCEKCTAQGDKSDAIDTMRSIGWSQSKSHGWVCPACLPDVLVPKKYRASRKRLAESKQ